MVFWLIESGSVVFGFRVFGFMISRFRVSGFRVSGFRISGFRVSGFKVFIFTVSGFRVSGFERPCSGHPVPSGYCILVRVHKKNRFYSFFLLFCYFTSKANL